MANWKPIKGYEGRYEVSDTGLIRRPNRISAGGKRLKKKILSPGLNSKGYRYAQLYSENVRKNFAVHRLVANAFVPNPERKPQVNHIDGNKENNAVSNLEWVTNSENQVSPSTICEIRSGRSWGHLQPALTRGRIVLLTACFRRYRVKRHDRGSNSSG